MLKKNHIWSSVNLLINTCDTTSQRKYLGGVFGDVSGIFFLNSPYNICCGYSLEVPLLGHSN